MRFNAVPPAPGFGAKLRELRDIKGWSQDRLANEMAIGRNQVSDYERGRRRPNNLTVVALDVLLGAEGALVREARPEARLFAAEREIARLQKLVGRQ